MDDDNDNDFLPPASTNTFAIPNDPKLLAEYELYKPSIGTRKLYSEQNREVFAEAFIENERLGTLADLCVRALAKLGTVHIAAPVQQDPLKMRIHYDSLDVNLPLKECYFVDDMRYWRRVVLAKSSDKSLQFKQLNEYDWKGKGVSIKFVELVEACPAAFWPEQEMTSLALLIRDHVRSMHIKHLQSLTDHAFKPYIESDSEIDVTSDESEQEEISSDEPDTDDEEEECEEEETQVPEPPKKIKGSVAAKIKEQAEKKISYGDNPKVVDEDDSEGEEEDNKSGSSADFEKERQERRRARHLRNAERQVLRNLQEKKAAAREERRARRSLLRRVPTEEIVTKKRKKGKKKIVGVFDIQVEPEPEDDEDKIADKRNKDLLLRRLKRYDYPAEHCHHIDLSFVRYFENLVSFTLEFLGPDMGRNYHKRHMNFSYDDITRLAKGLKFLEQLKIFRLRNSRMDSIKLQILARVLKSIDTLELIDFGYDQLGDDCGLSLAMLFERDNSVKALELEYNNLSKNAMEALGLALSGYHHHKLEYLGLSHNPLGDDGLRIICRYIIDTPHVEQLHLSGINTDKAIIHREICNLLRNHQPLKRLDIAAIPLDPEVGLNIIRALETNHNVTHFDCRACDFDSDEEFEADLIVRRNNYRQENTYLGDTALTESEIMDKLNEIKHPIIEKIHADMLCRDECIKNRPIKSPSEPSVEEEQVEEEYDIWAALGIKTKSVEKPEPEVVENDSVLAPVDLGPFEYDPNSFNLDQFREYVYKPGPGNRYYYIQQNKEP